MMKVLYIAAGLILVFLAVFVTFPEMFSVFDNEIECEIIDDPAYDCESYRYLISSVVYTQYEGGVPLELPSSVIDRIDLSKSTCEVTLVGFLGWDCSGSGTYIQNGEVLIKDNVLGCKKPRSTWNGVTFSCMGGDWTSDRDVSAGITVRQTRVKWNLAENEENCGTVPPRPCLEAVWRDYPDCEWDTSLCVSDDCGAVPGQPCDGAVWVDYPTCEWDISGCSEPPTEPETEWFWVVLMIIVIAILVIITLKFGR